jgi:excinuclease UvrABC helicase subunit UvrB
MRELVFLLEEESARALLEILLPRFLDQSIHPRFICFEGKQDLEKSLQKRLNAYINPNARFIILRDQDSDDCKKLKQSLLQKCKLSHKENVSLVRIACHELETFYLADLTAVEQGLGITGLSRHQSKAKYRSPDYLVSPSNSRN